MESQTLQSLSMIIEDTAVTKDTGATEDTVVTKSCTKDTGVTNL